jgi:hypothetical protein
MRGGAHLGHTNEEAAPLGRRQLVAYQWPGQNRTADTRIPDSLARGKSRRGAGFSRVSPGCPPPAGFTSRHASTS